MKIIAVEEHFMSAAVNSKVSKIIERDGIVAPAMQKFIQAFADRGEITDIGEQRVKRMQECGIDAQIIGYGNNSPMTLKKEDGAVELCQEANEELYEATVKFPGKFYGYATLPIDDVDEAVKELKRCADEFHFKGWMVNGTFQGGFLDDEHFFPIFKAASELNMPVYLHPDVVLQAVSDKYYNGSWSPMAKNNFAGAGIGWHYEVGVHVLRLILSGLLDKLPDLRLIAGHWGELLPYYMERLDSKMPMQVTGLKKNISEYLRTNFYTNPSGMYYESNMDYCLKYLGKEHVLWAQDFPYGTCDAGARTFLENYKLDNETMELVAHGNAEKLFRI